MYRRKKDGNTSKGERKKKVKKKRVYLLSPFFLETLFNWVQQRVQ